jgi:hypothetical protein
MKATQPKPSQAMPNKKGPNCWDCRFLAITWDVRMPYGCKLMGFRSKVIPSLEVLRTDGRYCSGFSAKPNLAKPQAAQTKPTQAVGNPSNRQDSDRRGPFTPINLIT